MDRGRPFDRANGDRSPPSLEPASCLDGSCFASCRFTGALLSPDRNRQGIDLAEGAEQSRAVSSAADGALAHALRTPGAFGIAECCGRALAKNLQVVFREVTE